MSDMIMHNKVSSSLSKTDPELSGLSFKDLESIDLKKGRPLEFEME